MADARKQNRGNRNAHGTKGNRGGGRKKGSATVVGGRAWFKALVQNETRKAKFVKALDRVLDGPDPVAAVNAFLRAFEHVYGRPPQALDIRAPKETAESVIYRAAVEGLDSAAFEDLPDSDVPVESTH